MKYFSNPQDAVIGNRLDLISGGENIFRQLLAYIRGANHRVYVSMYEFLPDKSGQAILQELVTAAKRGCDVKVVYDDVGSLFTKPSFFDPLVKAGGQVRIYHQVWPPKMDWKFIKRNHRKIICVDSSQAMLGGFNFSDPYFLPLEKKGYFDLVVKVSGSACAQAFHLFEHAWNSSTYQPLNFSKRWIEKRKKTREKHDGDSLVQVIGNDHFSERWKIRREILYVFSHATESIKIINPYFLPDPAIVKALILACKRGVKVEIVTPTYSDVRLIDLASMVVFKKLMKSDIEVFRWPGFIHAKAIIVDEKWTSVGSFNLDYRSLFHNLEVVVHALDKKFSEESVALFDSERQKSKKVSLQDWDQMPILSKLLARLTYRLRAFL